MAQGVRRALCLLAALSVAKVAAILLRILDGGAGGFASPWAPLVFLYSDLYVVILFAIVARFRRMGWILYFAIAAYCALNVPLARVFGTPLTWGMLTAAGGALWDSIAIYLTAANVLAVLAVLAAAAVLPRVIRKAPRGTSIIAAIAIAIAIAGPFAANKIDTGGLHRNALHALAASAWATRAGAPASLPDPPSLDPEGDARDLSSLRGAAAGRNVVWIGLESTAAQYLAPYGAAPDPMPEVSDLAARGLVFENVYCAYPESIKGLFSTLCATTPAAHTGADRYTAAAVPCAPLPGELRAAGYATGLFHSGRFVYLGMRGVVEERGFDRLDDAGAVGGRFASSFGVDESSTVRDLLAWVDTLPRGRPFFAMYLPIAGHHPYRAPGDAPRRFGDATEADAYRSDLAVADRAIGELRDGLRARGRDQDTLYVVVGDHGEAFHQHPGNFAHTLFLFEENVHVPLVIAGPGIPAARAPQVGSTVDVAPTLLALIGREAPARWQGRSLLAGRGVARFFADQAVWRVGLRDGAWKMIHDLEGGRSSLYRIDRDPGERDDLAEREPARVARYRAHLAAWAARQRALILNYRELVGR